MTPTSVVFSRCHIEACSVARVFFKVERIERCEQAYHLSTATPTHKLSGNIVTTWNFDDTNKAVRANVDVNANTFYYRKCRKCAYKSLVAEWELLTAFLLSISLACVLFTAVILICRLQVGVCAILLAVGERFLVRTIHFMLLRQRFVLRYRRAHLLHVLSFTRCRETLIRSYWRRCSACLGEVRILTS